MKDKSKAWGGKAYEKSWKWSDAIGGRVNEYAGKVSLAISPGRFDLLRRCWSAIAGERKVLPNDG